MCHRHCVRLALIATLACRRLHEPGTTRLHVVEEQIETAIDRSIDWAGHLFRERAKKKLHIDILEEKKVFVTRHNQPDQAGLATSRLHAHTSAIPCTRGVLFLENGGRTSKKFCK